MTMRRAPTKEKSSNVLANLGTTLVALLLTAAFVVFLLPVVIQTVLEGQLAKITGRSVQIADVHFSLTSPQFTVKKVLFSNPAGFPDAPLSEVGELRVRYAPSPTFPGWMVFKRVEIDFKDFRLVRNEKGVLNLPQVGALPKGKGSDIFKKFTLESRMVLENHPVNQKRVKEGKAKANMIWIWGGGGRLKLEPFEKKFKGIRGGVISAVDLLQGLGHYVGWKVICVPGATGYFDTDYDAKARYAIDSLKELDLIFVHIEATDEAGHSGLAEEKKKAIERIDEAIVGPLVNHLKKQGEYRLYVAPDHYTPTVKKTHIGDPVPFIFSASDNKIRSGRTYTEANAKSTGVYLAKGYELMQRLIGGWNSI